jgi:hypothetical protein
MSDIGPHTRFRQARERLGLSPDEVAAQSGITSSNVWDVESCEDELTSCCSPEDVRRLCGVIGIHPASLFGDQISEPPVTSDELVRRIHSECHLRGITLEQFEDVVGWRLSAIMEPPEKLLQDLTVDGLQWLCRELHIDWRRAL